MILKPICDQKLIESDREVNCGGRIPEIGSINWIELRERLRIAETEVERLRAELAETKQECVKEEGAV
jgi:hypothetical protein